MADEQKACRSTSPDDDPCTKPRGHKRQHGSPKAKYGWQDGVRRKATWVLPDKGYMTEGEYQAYGRFGY